MAIRWITASSFRMPSSRDGLRENRSLLATSADLPGLPCIQHLAAWSAGAVTLVHRFGRVKRDLHVLFRACHLLPSDEGRELYVRGFRWSTVFCRPRRFLLPYRKGADDLLPPYRKGTDHLENAENPGTRLRVTPKSASREAESTQGTRRIN